MKSTYRQYILYILAVLFLSPHAAIAADHSRGVSSLSTAAELDNSQAETTFYDVEATTESITSEGPIDMRGRKPKGSRSKYPELFKLMLDDPTSVQLKYQGKSVIAQLDDREFLVDSTHRLHPYEDSTSEVEPSSVGATSTEDTRKFSRYAQRKAKAIAEGRLEEFMMANRLRLQRQRESRQENEKLGVARYEYACRKMNREALKSIDPDEASARIERRKQQNRERSKRYYHANPEKERERNRKYREGLKKRVSGEGEVEETQGNTSASRIVHDFDLNDPAAYDEGDDDDDYVLE